MFMVSKAFKIDTNKPFFIFDTHGEWHATLIGGCIWDCRGEYVGFVRGENYDVYTEFGEWIGNLTKDGRIIRKRVLNERRPVFKDRPQRPAAKPKNLPPRAPLPPLTGDLGYHMIDVLDWDPDAFKNVPDLKDDLS
jgi:hypothetical protein